VRERERERERERRYRDGGDDVFALLAVKAGHALDGRVV
jgi:hypothetical protein